MTRLVVPLLIALLGFGSLLPIGTASAAPPRRMPVTITVQQIDPRTVTPGSTVTVTGTLTNTGRAAIDNLVLRLQSGTVLTSRDALRRNDEDPSPATTGFGEFIELDGSLPAGASMPFRYQTTAAELGLAELGVYPVLVNVNGVPSGDVEQRVGQVETYLPVFAQPVAAPTSVSWLWPLVDRPHRDGTGAFTDDDLAGAVASGGRLDRLLSIAEAAPAVPLTLVVDPMLVDTLQVMSAPAGYRLVDGSAGRGAAAAAAWLDRLRALATGHPVLALPYGDLDAVALTRGGLGDEVAAAVKAGQDLVAAGLDVQPLDELAWPVSGVLTEAALRVLRDAGISEVVLSESAFDPGSIDFRRTGSAVSTLQTGAGAATALVTDSSLDTIVAGSTGWPTGPRLAEQRYLAELAMITAEAPSTTRSLLIAPPRRFDPSTAVAGAMLSDTTMLPWLAASGVTDLSAAPTTDRGPLVYPAPASRDELGDPGLRHLQDAVAGRKDFASMLVTATASDRQAAQAVTGPLEQAVWRAGSSYWREDPAGFAAAVASAGAAVEAQRERVLLVVPADGTYSLASAAAPLIFTVANQLPLPVQVRITVDASGAAGLSTDNVGMQTLPAAGRALIEVPATVQRSGEFRVSAAIFTPAGGTLGAPVQLRVRSTAYGVIALIITVAAGALLVLLFALRLIRRIRAGRDRRQPRPSDRPGQVGQPPRQAEPVRQ